MSLIFGLCLPRKVYLVSDSRLSSSDGSYKDDFSKWLDLNPRLSVVVANSAYQASWILKKIMADIRPTAGWDWGFTELEAYLRANLEKYGNQFYAETGLVSDSVSMIFGGFEKDKKLILESGRLGEVMSVPVIAAGEGVSVNQNVDMTIINAFSKVLNEAAAKGQEVGAGTEFEVDLPKPRVLAVTIRPTNQGAEVQYEDALPYDGLVFNPNFRTERVKLPAELIGQLEYRDRDGESGDDGWLYAENAEIIKYVKRLNGEKGWDTVGGTILPLLVTPDGSGFVTGEYVYRNNDGTLSHGGLTEIDGKPHYYDEDRSVKPYRFVYDYMDEKDSNKSHAKI
jgi:hypothetical protein